MRGYPSTPGTPAAWSHEIEHGSWREKSAGSDRALPPARRARRGAARRLLASPAAAVDGTSRRRPGRLRLSRPGLQRFRPLHLHAGPEDHQPVRLRAVLIRSPRNTGWCGSGPATRRSPIRPGSRTSTGTTVRSGSGEGGTFYDLKCDYRLVIDNLMDLTHETYVHAGSIGDDAITDAPFEVTHTEDTATVTRWMIDIEPPPFWAKQLGKPGNVDRWQIIHFQAPSIVVGEVGVARRPAPARRRATGRRASTAVPRGHHAGDGHDLPLLLELRAHVPHGRRRADARSPTRPRQRRQGRLRSGSRRFSKRSRPRSRAIPTCTCAT